MTSNSVKQFGTWQALSIFALLAATPSLVRAGRVDGFTEPSRSVEVATTEVGIVTTIRVLEGSRVERGDVLATLDDEVQRALLSIASKNLELRGRHESATAEAELRRQRLQKLESLHGTGHARREEVERAKADFAIAKAQVLVAEEELLLRKLEYDRTAIQVQRRIILAPVSGVVAIILKEPGEFVAPTDPHLLRLVQLDELLATFSVPSNSAERLTVGSKARVALHGRVVEGILDRIAPLTDAESDTVRVRIRIDNKSGEFRSGQRCSLLLPD